MANQAIAGTLAAAVTPLRDGGALLDEDAFAPLCEFYEASAIEGLLVLGTTGEGILLTVDERRRVAELAVDCAGGLRIIVHCGAQTTAETAALAQHAAQAGADGVAVIAPPYFGFDAGELTEHFAAAAAACAPLPFYIYEYADRSGYAVPPSVVERVRERAPNLVGMKVSDAPFDRVKPYLETGLDVFIGAEAVIPEDFAAARSAPSRASRRRSPSSCRRSCANPQQSAPRLCKQCARRSRSVHFRRQSRWHSACAASQ